LNIIIIRHPGNPQVLKDFSRWIDIKTVFDNNPQGRVFEILGETGDTDVNAKDLARGYSGYDERDWPSHVFYYVTTVANDKYRFT